MTDQTQPTWNWNDPSDVAKFKIYAEEHGYDMAQIDKYIESQKKSIFHKNKQLHD